jgi:aminoglycoside/choline kinase family phosphotransferase
LLDEQGWGDADAHPLPGDASARRYTRLNKGGKTAILMQDPEGDVTLFARLARHLNQIGLSAPQIYAEAPGLLLIEDFGTGLLADLAKDPAQERALYILATEALIALHRHAPPADLPIATPDYLAGAIDLAFLHYTDAPDAIASASQALLPALRAFATPNDVMILRDYHAENALLLPDRQGPARLGLLDFQDALRGHRAYDLASLLQDARRDVSPEVAQACIAHFIQQTQTPEAPFRASLAVLGAQRNLRILGIFARLAKLRGKPGYIDLIPRVWAHLQDNLRHPELAPLRAVLEGALPHPDSTHLNRLKSTCPTP